MLAEGVADRLERLARTGELDKPETRSHRLLGLLTRTLESPRRALLHGGRRDDAAGRHR